ncbi:hypothetical protein QJ850_gp111 [Acanthamoeba polyphaga mimivirus]|uniref:Uncharacterized protein n=1 Tax=Acanthamoeba polyphaga mimivirus Kroon TaxID=3069720 RepID=A0A0G2Y460_9VIRU|nr:hypothetical protein QJ850_gp111 [Acanthamoeba polyphaga mimivirus]AKI80588.1 hypothetical protein [Acanthamoeba polyphaga mimivirus Kroon]
MDILGNIPSQYWIIVSNTFGNNTNFEFNYDSLKEIYDMEIDYFNYVINHLIKETYNSSKILTTLKMLDKIYIKLYDYTKLNLYQESIDYVNVEIKKWFKTNFHDGNYSLETKQMELLKYIYGREQCKYAHELVEQAYFHLSNESGNNGLIASWMTYVGSYFGGFYKKNAFEIILGIHERQKNDINNKLKQITVDEVKPLDEVYKKWIGLKIY